MLLTDMDSPEKNPVFKGLNGTSQNETDRQKNQTEMKTLPSPLGGGNKVAEILW